MYDRMKYFFEEHILLYWSRYGFPQAHSTQHVVLDMIETIQTNMDEKIFVHVEFLLTS